MKAIIRNSFKLFNKSIRNKYITIIVLIVLIPMTITGIYFYSSISGIFTENMNRSIEQLIQQVNSNIQSQLSIIDNTSILFMSDPSVAESLEKINSENEKYHHLLSHAALYLKT